MSILSQNIVYFRVKSLSDGNFRVEPFYEKKEWPMEKELDGSWSSYPGFLDRMTLAEEIERVLNEEEEE